MSLKLDIKMYGNCKHCGERFNALDNSFEKHLAYEHDIYCSKWIKFKAKIRNKLKRIVK